MAKVIDLTGKKFGRLKVINRASNKGKQTCWNCLCECGGTLTAQSRHLKAGGTKSCGCLRKDLVAKRNTVHGLWHHPLYGVWLTMNTRCHTPSAMGYPGYGGRGITVCYEWQQDLKVFFDWAIVNGWKAGLQLDRKDNDLGYSPENCRFVTRLANIHNTRLIRSTNTTGYRGISLNKNSGKYQAAFRYNHKYYHVGCFSDKVEAAQERDNFVIKNGFDLPLNFPKEVS